MISGLSSACCGKGGSSTGQHRFSLVGYQRRIGSCTAFSNSEASACLTKHARSARREPLCLGEGNAMPPVSQPDLKQQRPTSDVPPPQSAPAVGGPHAYYVLAVLFVVYIFN